MKPEDVERQVSKGIRTSGLATLVPNPTAFAHARRHFPAPKGLGAEVCVNECKRIRRSSGF